MSSGVRGNDNTATSHDLSYTLQSTCGIALDGSIEYMRKEPDQSNEHEQSSESGQSTKCTCDPGSNAPCTCTGTASGSSSTRSTEHTSFPCAHCRDHVNSPIDPSREPAIRSAASAYIEWIYSAYAIATGASREDASAGIRASDEPRNFKQADASSRDTVERRTGIPAGVTI